MNCTPLIPGRRMSSTITSGRCSRQAASAAAPSATADTTLMSDCPADDRGQSLAHHGVVIDECDSEEAPRRVWIVQRSPFPTRSAP